MSANTPLLLSTTEGSELSRSLMLAFENVRLNCAYDDAIASRFHLFPLGENIITNCG